MKQIHNKNSMPRRRRRRVTKNNKHITNDPTRQNHINAMSTTPNMKADYKMHAKNINLARKQQAG